MGVSRKKYVGARVSCLVIASIIIFVFPAAAQYQLYRWANFEKGEIPSSSVPIGENFRRSVSLVKYDEASNMPPAFHDSQAEAQVGQYGLRFQASPNIWIAGLADNVVLDRDQLGNRGRALYQADFFMPPEGEYLPSLAVLAMEPIPRAEIDPRSFYRFGLTRNRFLYFSHVVQEEEEARIFESDDELIKKIPRPGWHRFAIVFEGRDLIRCYIDGHEAGFSPIREYSLRKLQVGIMMADKENTYVCYADNPSIQWTPEDAPLPESPYAASWGGEAATRSMMQVLGASGGKVDWLNPEEGWRKSKSSGKPMLVYFYAPNISAVNKLEDIINTNSGAQQFINQYIPIKIDMNQLSGGRLAGKFGIFKIPAMLIMNSNGQVLSKAIFGNYDSWQSFSSRLRR